MATALPERPLPPVPPAARAIALLLASTPSVTDAPPRVLQQLLEFSYRYTAQILQEAQVYADHAGRPGRLTMDDVTLAIQARVGYEFGGRVPKEVSIVFRATSLLYSSKPLTLFLPLLTVYPWAGRPNKCRTTPTHPRNLWYPAATPGALSSSNGMGP
jgi:transcription initiation factor TFIID subunit 9B